MKRSRTKSDPLRAQCHSRHRSRHAFGWKLHSCRVSLIIIVAAVSSAISQPATGQDILWLRQFGTPGFDRPFAISASTSGVYLGGQIEGPFALPGQIHQGGPSDAFVRRYDVDGNEAWTRQFGTSGPDRVFGIAVDSSGVYLAGGVHGSFPGQFWRGGLDAFVRKYDLEGNVLWTRQFGTPMQDEVCAIAVGPSGVYVSGWVTGILFGQTSAGGFDAFVVKYDFDGNEIWTRQFGTNGFDKGRGISLDATGVFVTGEVGGALPGQISAGGSDAYVRKYDFDGNEVWTRQFGSPSGEIAFGISADSSGVYVGGRTGGTFPGQTSAGGIDAFVRKYDAVGNDLWTAQFGNSGVDEALAISVDASGVYVAGSAPGSLPDSIEGHGGFVRKYDAIGNAGWTLQFGDESSGLNEALAVSVQSSDVYVAGFVAGALPGQISAGGFDAFLAQVLTAPEPRGTGFWKHQCSNLGFHQVSAEELDSWFSKVEIESSAFTECAAIGCEVFQLDGPQNEMRPKAVRQLLALWLNVASDRLPPDTEIVLPDLTDALTVAEAIDEIEAIVCDLFASRTDLEVSKDIAEALNGGSEDMELASEVSLLTVSPGGQKWVRLAVINMSPYPRSYDVSVSGPWSLQLSHTRVNGLAPGGVAIITVTAIAPAFSPLGTTAEIQVVAEDRHSHTSLERELSLTFRVTGTGGGRGSKRMLPPE